MGGGMGWSPPHTLHSKRFGLVCIQTSWFQHKVPSHSNSTHVIVWLHRPVALLTINLTVEAADCNLEPS